MNWSVLHILSEEKSWFHHREWFPWPPTNTKRAPFHRVRFACQKQIRNYPLNHLAIIEPL